MADSFEHSPPELGGRSPSHLALGSAGELFMAGRIALFGYQVYRPLADDRGVDLVIDVGDGRHVMVQVKSAHAGKYVFMKKATFALTSWVAVGLVVFDDDHDRWPDLFVIPAPVWKSPVAPFVDYDYPNGKSVPEYGLNIRKNWREELAAWSATQEHVDSVLRVARQ